MSLIAQVPSRQRQEHVLQAGRVGAQLGEWNTLPRELLEQSGNRAVQLRYVHHHATVFRVDIAHALNPAHDASGRVDIWLNGAFCGAYQGPMADRDYGARRNGAPFINAQPRFGIYRDWRAETQTIYFDKIMFWNADPAGHPDWNMSPPPG